MDDSAHSISQDERSHSTELLPGMRRTYTGSSDCDEIKEYSYVTHLMQMDVVMPAEKIDGIFGKNPMNFSGDFQLSKQTRTIGWGLRQPGLVEGAPAHGRRVGPEEL